MICRCAAELFLVALTLVVWTAPGAASNLRAQTAARGSLLTDILEAVTEGDIQSLSPFKVSDGDSKWVVASIPPQRVVMYVHPPDTTWRPLVMSGLVSPKSIAIDKQRKRLYVVDTAVAKIYWYQLHAPPDGKTLMTDGTQHLAVQGILARTIALGATGDLYFTGTTAPLPPDQPVDGVFLMDITTLANCEATGNYNVPPKQVWNKGITGSLPDALGLDAFNVWWGNQLDGDKKGSVVKASLTPPLVDPQQAITIKANNEATVYSLALTPTLVFYGAENAVHVIQKSKVGQDCGANGCPLVSKTAQKPTAMVWDGDGTIFLADNEQGALFMFPSESRAGNVLEKFCDCADIFGMDVFEEPTDAE
mmetsp:Transcript_16933/g.31631  ORF Transcript_16933/g.31631 Transcript_16933/m.31631 type:complete len:364 (-) Transcript_16933:76-1167(-)